jgi:response regulator of citrate/malate metabolism
VKILLISDNTWVKESLEKYLDFDHELTHLTEHTTIESYFDYIFVDMQVQNNGGPSIIRELKRNDSTKNSFMVLLADRDVDEIQAKRVESEGFMVKPITKSKINNFFNLN